MLNVIKNRYIYFWFSGILFILSFIAIFFFPLNLGIDMTGWTQNEFQYQTYQFNLAEITQEAETIKGHINISWNIINSINVYKITGEKSFVVEAWFSSTINEQELEEFKVWFRNQLEEWFQQIGDIELSRYTNIGASFWDYIKNTAKLTLIIAIVAIALYIAYAFSGTVSGVSSLSFGIVTVITLFHDVVISSGLYILTSFVFLEFQVDTFFITALLTILGYSINDTIVIFDRIRSNLKDFWGKGKKLDEIINMSINETLTRSVYTSATLAFVLICIFVVGPESIAGFTLAMIYGTIIGTFSSIFIASPILYEINKNKELKVYVKKEVKPEDKIVI